jgi:glycosyltransferase involved in cell wall biosynthesis
MTTAPAGDEVPPAGDLRVALVLPSAERGAYWIPLIRALQDRTASTVVFTAEPGPLEPGTPRTAGLDIRTVGGSRYIATGSGEAYDRGFYVLSPSLLPALRAARPDVVVVMAFSMWTGLAVIGRRLGWWRLVILYDGSSPDVDRRDSRVRTAVRRVLARSADALVSNSEAGRRYLADHLRVGDRARRSPFMVTDPRALGGGEDVDRTTTDRRTLLAVGVLEQRKGIHLLLDALATGGAAGAGGAAAVAEDLPDWRLVLVGDGPEQRALEQQAAACGIADRVEFAGWVDHAALGRWFAEADAFVFPTLDDTWGVVLLEAMAFGAPVIASVLAGSAELVEEGVTGHVVDPRDPAALRRAVAAVIGYREVARRMGRAAREAVAAHSPDAAAGRLLEVLDGGPGGTGAGVSPRRRAAGRPRGPARPARPRVSSRR